MFHKLNPREKRWVEETLRTMTLDEKIGQLDCEFAPRIMSDKCDHRAYLERYPLGIVWIGHYGKPPHGGMRNSEISAGITGPFENILRIPPLFCGDYEAGLGEEIEGFTKLPRMMSLGATFDPADCYEFGRILSEEARIAGINLICGTVSDLNLNPGNPVTNVRSISDNAEYAARGLAEVTRGIQDNGVAACSKHFPGDGRDERDQHLLVSVNDCTFSEWTKTYGMVYAKLIEEGIPAIMAGHIAAPYVAREVRHGISERDALLPASQSEALLTGVLREKLAFNGLITTDSTLMVGYMQSMPRSIAVPRSIECGADMILFNRSIEEDIGYIRDGLKNGTLSKRRLDEAVLRILASKMALGLFEKQFFSVPERTLPVEVKKSWVNDCADQAVTLVKDDRDLLPLSPKKTKRIYLNVIENTVDNRSPFAQEIKRRLQREGFSVTLRKRKYPFDPAALTLEKITPAVNKALEETMCNTEQFVGKYDLAMIVLNMQTASNATVVRVNWNVLFGMGNDLPWYSGEMPLVAVSFCNPYHLLDVPMAHAYINAYTNNQATLDAVFDKLMGRSAFYGKSPVDPFCGKLDTRL